MSITVKILPRHTFTRQEFVETTPVRSIALDGMVSGGPFFDEQTLHVNFDHHDGVIREATMSTAMQVFMAIKGGLMNGFSTCSVYINDTDQDTALAVWLLQNYKLFERTQSVPHINRLLALTDRLDITGGAFPINLSDEIVEQHNWVYDPYTILRTSGQLATADQAIMQSNLEAVLARLNKFLMGQGGRKPLDTRHEILYRSDRFWVVDEIGGNEARYYLYSQGMDAFISIVSRRPDGRLVCVYGRRSRFIPFPLCQLYLAINVTERDRLDITQMSDFRGCGGSDIIGGSDRKYGTGLSWQEQRDIALELLSKQ